MAQTAISSAAPAPAMPSTTLTDELSPPPLSDDAPGSCSDGASVAEPPAPSEDDVSVELAVFWLSSGPVALLELGLVPVAVLRAAVDELGSLVAVVVVSVERVEAPVVVDSLRSLLCQLIWIMGANRLSASMDALSSGTAWLVTSLISDRRQVTVGTVVDVATMMHVWPPMFAQP